MDSSHDTAVQGQLVIAATADASFLRALQGVADTPLDTLQHVATVDALFALLADAPERPHVLLLHWDFPGACLPAALLLFGRPLQHNVLTAPTQCLDSERI